MHTPARDANLLGALGLALADRLADAAAAGPGGTATTAMVAISGEFAGASIDALAGILDLSHSGTVRLVDRLASQGLVERRRAADQRSVALVATPAGRRAARHALTRREAHMHELLVVLTDDQRAELRAILERILGDVGDERRTCRLCDTDACGQRRRECPVVRAKH